MPDSATLAKETFASEESSDSFDLDFRVMSVETPSKGPGPDYLGGGSGGCGADTVSCFACTWTCF